MLNTEIGVEFQCVQLALDYVEIYIFQRIRRDKVTKYLKFHLANVKCHLSKPMFNSPANYLVRWPKKRSGKRRRVAKKAQHNNAHIEHNLYADLRSFVCVTKHSSLVRSLSRHGIAVHVVVVAAGTFFFRFSLTIKGYLNALPLFYQTFFFCLNMNMIAIRLIANLLKKTFNGFRFLLTFFCCLVTK